jgi:N-acetyl-anhydromuramyl-L-alanine amidase AmpD
MSLDTSKIKQVAFNKDEYFQEEVKKTQIVLHHTAGGPSGVATANMWDADKRGRIATCVIITGKGAKNSADGEIVQIYSSKFWAYHLGIKTEVFKAYKIPAKILDKSSIGIEICNWGFLEKIGDKFFNYVDKEVPADEVCELDEPYKGQKYWHRYTDAQIESVKNLLLYWRDLYGIPLDFDYAKMFSVSMDALKNVPGLYTHNSYRKDKSDIYPCPRMIEMLKSL